MDSGRSNGIKPKSICAGGVCEYLWSILPFSASIRQRLVYSLLPIFEKYSHLATNLLLKEATSLYLFALESNVEITNLLNFSTILITPYYININTEKPFFQVIFVFFLQNQPKNVNNLLFLCLNLVFAILFLLLDLKIIKQKKR